MRRDRDPKNLTKCVMCFVSYREKEKMYLGCWRPIDGGKVFMAGLFCRNNRTCHPLAAAMGRITEWDPKQEIWVHLVRMADSYEWEAPALQRMVLVIGAVEGVLCGG